MSISGRKVDAPLSKSAARRGFDSRRRKTGLSLSDFVVANRKGGLCWRSATRWHLKMGVDDVYLKGSTVAALIKRIVVITSVLLFVGAIGVARAQILTGNIIGTVRDSSGAVLPGVTITVTSPALPAGPSSTVTNDKGE